MGKNKTFRRLNLLIPTVLFVLIFVLVSGVLTLVFLRAADMSASAGALTDAAQICRSGVQRFRADPDSLAPTEYYNALYEETGEEAGTYTLTVTRRTEADGIVTGVLTVYDREGNPLYTLTAQAFRQEG